MSAFRSGYLNLGKFRMAVLETGQGEPAILLHGFGLDARSMSGVASTLKDRYRVILPEWRGHGGTRCPPQESFYRYKLLREDLAALMDMLKLERAHLVGHSMGGQIALMQALAEPERVTSLTTLGAGPCREVTAERERAKWNAAADYYTSASAQKLLRGLCGMSPVSDAAAHKPPLAQLYAKARGPELGAFIRGAFLNVESNADQCPKLKPPALVMAGIDDADWFSPAHQLANLIPGARWAGIPNSGHFPHLEQPDAVCRLIGQFLDLTSQQD